MLALPEICASSWYDTIQKLIPKVSKIWKQKRTRNRCSLPFGRVTLPNGILESTFRLGLEPFLRNQRREEVAWFSLFKNIQREVQRPNDILWATREVSFFGFCRGWLLLVSFVNSLLTEQDPVARVVRLLLSREESSLILCSEPVRPPIQLYM